MDAATIWLVALVIGFLGALGGMMFFFVILPLLVNLMRAVLGFVFGVWYGLTRW